MLILGSSLLLVSCWIIVGLRSLSAVLLLQVLLSSIFAWNCRWQTSYYLPGLNTTQFSLCSYDLWFFNPYDCSSWLNIFFSSQFTSDGEEQRTYSCSEEADQESKKEIQGIWSNYLYLWRCKLLKLCFINSSVFLNSWSTRKKWRIGKDRCGKSRNLLVHTVGRRLESIPESVGASDFRTNFVAALLFPHMDGSLHVETLGVYSVINLMPPLLIRCNSFWWKIVNIVELWDVMGYC